MVPYITLEEHYIAPSVWNKLEDYYNAQFGGFPGANDKLRDLGEGRIAAMDEGQVTMQVLSHGPGSGEETPELNKAANDELYAAIQRHPTRFAGFATLPMADPAAAAEELERCVTKLGFVGALIDNHVHGQYYDDEKFWPVFAVAERLDVPIYLHPHFPTDDQLEYFKGNYGEAVVRSLSASGWGWHSDTAVHVLKLFAAGVFDKFPRFKLVVGHFGEMLPFMLGRINRTSARYGSHLKRDFQTVYDENIYITLSAVWSVDPMATIMRNTKLDHILFSIDYPFSQTTWGRDFMEELKKSGIVTEEQFEAIAYKNAEKLLRIKAT